MRIAHLIGAAAATGLRRLISLLLCLGVLAAARSTRADEPAARERRALGFSRLQERTARDTPMRFGQEVYRVFVLQPLRGLGFRAVGGEDDPFGRSTAAPELVLGGVVRELDCNRVNGAFNCRFGLEWQVLDVRAGRVIYEAMVRGGVYDIRDNAPPTDVGKQMLAKAVDSLIARARFRQLLEPAAEALGDQPQFSTASFKRCSSGALEMPRQAAKATRATVVIEVKGGVGSGFFLNDEGLILTAAHVVANADVLNVRLEDGRTFGADVIRSNTVADVALLRIRGGLKSNCLEPSLTETAIGADVYAIGAPSGGQLAFSLTRGIVSGLRNWRGGTLLQTDTAINPGNSGGPLLGTDGRVKATVTAKLVGTAIEGLAFGVPVQSGLLALGLKADTSSAAELSEPAETSRPTEAARPFVDRADPLASLDPAEDERRARAARLLRQAREGELAQPSKESPEVSDERPAISPVASALRWGGLTLAAAGVITALATSAAYDRDSTTKREYETLRLYNDLGFVSMAVGAGAFGASFLIGPSATSPDPGAQAATSARRSMFLQVRGSY